MLGCLAIHPSVAKNLCIVILLDTTIINVINVKLCMIVGNTWWALAIHTTLLNSNASLTNGHVLLTIKIVLDRFLSQVGFFFFFFFWGGGGYRQFRWLSPWTGCYIAAFQTDSWWCCDFYTVLWFFFTDGICSLMCTFLWHVGPQFFCSFF